MDSVEKFILIGLSIKMKLLPIFASGALGGMMHSYSSPCDKVEYFLGSKANFKNQLSMKKRYLRNKIKNIILFTYFRKLKIKKTFVSWEEAKNECASRGMGNFKFINKLCNSRRIFLDLALPRSVDENAKLLGFMFDKVGKFDMFWIGASGKD